MRAGHALIGANVLDHVNLVRARRTRPTLDGQLDIAGVVQAGKVIREVVEIAGRNRHPVDVRDHVVVLEVELVGELFRVVAGAEARDPNPRTFCISAEDEVDVLVAEDIEVGPFSTLHSV